MRSRRLGGVALGMLWAFGVATAWAGDGDPPSRRAVRSAVSAVLDAGVPAAAVVITTPRHTENLSDGYANIERKFPRMRLRERWRVGGVSKAYTAAVVFRLVEGGVLGLGDTVAEWLPGLLPAGGAITVEQLLGQTSGLVDYTTTDAFIAAITPSTKVDLPPQTLVGFVAGLPLLFAPGSAYAYSNTNAIVLGLIVEAATGTSFANELATQVTDPLHLQRTALPDVPDLVRPRTRGYDFPVRGAGNPRDVTRAYSPSLAWTTGSVVSTALELGRFLRARMAGRIFGPSLVETSIATLRPGDSTPKGPGRNSVGLGIFEYRIAGCGTLYGHTGEYPGYRAYAATTRSGQRSVVVLVNVTNLSTEQEQRLDELWRLASCRALQAR